MVIKNLLINKIKKDANPPKPISIEDYNRMDKAKKKKVITPFFVYYPNFSYSINL